MKLSGLRKVSFFSHPHRFAQPLFYFAVFWLAIRFAPRHDEGGIAFNTARARPDRLPPTILIKIRVCRGANIPVCHRFDKPLVCRRSFDQPPACRCAVQTRRFAPREGTEITPER